MKKNILAIASIVLACQPAFAQEWGEPTPADTLQSTIVLPGNRVIFQLYAPDAQSVEVTGDLPWDADIKFVKQPNGVWKGELAQIGDGVFRYRFLVNGVAVIDPKSPEGQDTAALLNVDSTGNSFFAMKDVPHGAVSQRWYWSETLSSWRRMHVWTPAGYETSGQHLPVLYLIHGGGDVDNSWPTVGAANWILDNLLAEGKMVPMIVVMPNGTIREVENEVAPFAEDMAKSIIPFIESNYRVLKGKDNRAVAGLSMGGMETLEVVFNNPGMFGYAWVLSSSFMPGEDPFKEAMRLDVPSKVDQVNKTVKNFMFTQGGEEDIAYYNGIDTRKVLAEMGLKFGYMDVPGGHSWVAWRQNLYDLAPTLFK